MLTCAHCSHTCSIWQGLCNGTVSVSLSVPAVGRRCCGFAAVCPAGSRSIAAAAAGECGQCHVVSIRTWLNTDLLPTALVDMVMRSVVSLRPSVFTVAFEPTDLDICMCMSHDHSSRGIESQGYKSRSRVMVRVSKDRNAVGLTSILDGG